MARVMSSRDHRLNIAVIVPRLFRRPCRTFDTTSMRGTRLNCWNTIAQRLCQARIAAPLSASTSVPSTISCPDEASVSRFTIRRSVDLPAPELPMIPTIIGRSMTKLAASTAFVWPNRRVTLRASICIGCLPLFAASFDSRPRRSGDVRVTVG